MFKRKKTISANKILNIQSAYHNLVITSTNIQTPVEIYWTYSQISISFQVKVRNHSDTLNEFGNQFINFNVFSKATSKTILCFFITTLISGEPSVYLDLKFIRDLKVVPSTEMFA